MKRNLLLLPVLLVASFAGFLSVRAQTKWIDPMDQAVSPIHNRAWNEEIGRSYARLPVSTQGVFRDAVYNLGQNSAGLVLVFTTDAEQIKVNYTVKGDLSMAHMPATGVSGVDLYVEQPSGQWAFVYGKYHFADTVSYLFSHLLPEGERSPSDRTYRLFLPLYNTLDQFRIGVPEKSHFRFVSPSKEKPVVVYGTSICQGGCASRPAMAWTNILYRAIGLPVINLGFSGNGRLESEVLDLIAGIDARIIVLDCLPNLTATPEDEVYRLLVSAVKQLRRGRCCPILLSEHSGYNSYHTRSAGKEEIDRVNRAAQRAFVDLKREGVPSLYYLSMFELAYPADAWVDDVHPTDLGMSTHARAMEKKIGEIEAENKR